MRTASDEYGAPSLTSSIPDGTLTTGEAANQYEHVTRHLRPSQTKGKFLALRDSFQDSKTIAESGVTYEPSAAHIGKILRFIKGAAEMIFQRGDHTTVVDAGNQPAVFAMPEPMLVG